MFQKYDHQITALHYLFIKDNGCVSDREFLESFGVDNYKVNLNPDYRLGSNIYISRLGIWSAFLDSWCALEGSPGLRLMTRSYEVYRIIIGDIDDSHQFDYFLKGRRRRHYIYDEFDHRGGKVLRNRGRRFKCEKRNKSVCPLSKMLNIASELGIPHEKIEDSYVTYTRPKAEHASVGMEIS